MSNATDTDPNESDSVELFELAAELLSEAGDLSGTSVTEFVEFLIDRWPARSAGSIS